MTIPVEMMGHWRSGLLAELARAGDALRAVNEAPGSAEDPASYREQLRRLERVAALLDEFGWSDLAEPVEVSLSDDADVLLVAFEGELAQARHAVADVSSGREQDPEKTRRLTDRLEALSMFWDEALEGVRQTPTPPRA